MPAYTIRREAIQREIVGPLANSPYDTDDEHTLELIADDVLGDHEQGYACVVDEEAFWASVIDNVS